MINFALLTKYERERLAKSPFGGFKARQVPSNWREILAGAQSHPAILRSEDTRVGMTGKRKDRD